MKLNKEDIKFIVSQILSILVGTVIGLTISFGIMARLGLN